MLLHAVDSQAPVKPCLQRLLEERYRAHRYGRPLSRASVSLVGWADRERDALSRGLEDFLPRRRPSDFISRTSPDRVDLVLPETDLAGAWKVSIRLRSHLLSCGRLDGCRPILEKGAISVEEIFGAPETPLFAWSPKAPCSNLPERLREERFRSDRNDRPFSLILISLDRFRNGTRPALLDAVDRFSRSNRLSDAWGWTADGSLALVLPETNEEGGQRAAARLVDLLEEAGAWKPGTGKPCAPPCSIHEYPKILKKTLFVALAGNAGPAVPPERSTGPRTVRPEPASRSLDTPTLCEQICSGRHPRIRSALCRLDEVARRGLDLAVILAGALLAVPLMLFVALLVKLSSNGPVLFRQRRVGRNGVPFTLFKFRTMHHNCDQRVHRDYVTRYIQNQAEPCRRDGQEYFKLVDDPRVTRLGAFLRRTALDELPQLINVLRGEMSLVGPRPPIDYEVERYETWQLRRVLEVKPGITGLWQVLGRSTTRFDQQVRLDLRYVGQQSLVLNLWILFKTIRVVLQRQGGF